MSIDEAIKVLEESDWLETNNHSPEYTEAVQLGIEALERIQINRKAGVIACLTSLAGETEK